MRKTFTAVSAAIALCASAAFAADPVKYEAENAAANVTLVQCSQLPQTSNDPCKDELGGLTYVRMREGTLTFSVNAPAAGFYTVWVQYSQTCDVSKEQNLVVNGAPAATMAFPGTGTFNGSDCGPASFKHIKAAGKIKLNSGANTLAITKSWGWVDIDYIEVGPHVPEPFSISVSPVTPGASVNARKMYQFLRENFQKKVISGAMTDRAAQDDGKYTPHTLSTHAEMSHIKSASGKTPALLGLDFMHSSGLNSDEQWFMGYTTATLGLAETIFNAGGFPTICWHWKDPLKKTEGSAFYSEYTDFELTKAFNASITGFNTASDEYKALVADIDLIAGYLKQLGDKNVPVLWRPLHEAAGGWFWWGRGGRDSNPTVAANAAKACKALWIFMFERMVNHHGLNNLIWVWTCEEGGSALDWYPGDQYVDIVGRDWYPNPNQREKVHGSRVSNFESLKEIYGGRKIIALSENGAVPHPDSLVNDGAQWSWFMPWYGDFTTQVNTAGDWNYIMNHPYVITLEDMPGWDNYQLSTTGIRDKVPAVTKAARGTVSVRSHRGVLELRIDGGGARSVELFSVKGAKIAVLSNDNLKAGNYRFPVKGIARQMSVVRVRTADNRVLTMPVRIE